MKNIQLTIQYAACFYLLMQLCQLRKLCIQLQIAFVSQLGVVFVKIQYTAYTVQRPFLDVLLIIEGRLLQPDEHRGSISGSKVHQCFTLLRLPLGFISERDCCRASIKSTGVAVSCLRSLACTIC